MKSNIFSGITVGIIALPLSMALAIATGVPPQYGLYTAIVAGIIASIAGSSKINISGPTAAFVVILIPIVQEYGLEGLLISGLLAGIFQILMGLFRLGTLIELIPYPITVGFTTGIAVVIATFQIKDFFGLHILEFNGDYIDKVVMIYHSFNTFRIEEIIVGFVTLFILILWEKTGSKIPSALIALTIATIYVSINNFYFSTYDIATINSTFHYNINGVMGNGIPPIPLQFGFPWDFSKFNLDLIYKLIPHAIAISILGALESLLCAVISDGMTGNNTNPNKELIGQGITNIVVPFFGGIPATAAIARTVVNIKSGGTNKISSIVHSLFILLSIIFISQYLSYLPMASLAALLLIVAWNMSEIKHFIYIIKVAPKHDIYVMLCCFILTVLIDMQIAVGIGMILAGILFIKRTINLYSIELINKHSTKHPKLPDDICIYDINGPMFFGASQIALKTILKTDKKINIIILNMEHVSMIDMTGIVALKSILDTFKKKKVLLIFSGLEERMILKLEKAGLKQENGELEYYDDLKVSIMHIK